MKYIKYLLALLAFDFLIQFVSATSTGTMGSTTTGTGPLGLLVTLGIENFPGLTISQAQFIYRWITCIGVLFVALSADSRSSTVFCILATAVAAVCAWWHWFTVLLPDGTINTFGPWSIVILMAVVTVIMYMTETNKFTFGLSSPGDPIFKLFMFFVLFSSVLGIMSSAEIFKGIPGMPDSPQLCTTNHYENCQVNGATQLQTIEGSQTSTGSFGILSDVWDNIMTGANAAYSAISLIGGILISLVAISWTIQSIYPWIWNSPAAVGMISILQFFIWFVYYTMIARWVSKSMPGEMRL